MDTEKKIAEIREALEKATPEPWTVQGFSVRKSDGCMIRQERPRAAAPEAWEQIDERYAADARLIANAPEWLRFLLEERAELIEGLRMCIFNHGCWHQEDYVAYIRDLLKEIGVTASD